MKRLVAALVAAFFVAALWAAPTAIAYDPAMPTTANSVVKVSIGRGHGSAVMIGTDSEGRGIYLTAHHVAVNATEDKPATIKTDQGMEARAEVLWGSEKYDIALIRAELVVSKSDLECRRPEFGEQLEMRGNPLNMEHISTWGRVAGKSHKVGNAWENVVPIDGALAGGMSGGAVFDTNGDLVGINVGAAVQPRGFSGSLVGLSYIVPGDVICDLMGRV